jgi:hypothetical protein
MANTTMIQKLYCDIRESMNCVFVQNHAPACNKRKSSAPIARFNIMQSYSLLWFCTFLSCYLFYKVGHLENLT